MFGLIAQELQEVIPSLVHQSHGSLSVDYQSLFSILLASHLDVLRRLEQLEEQLVVN